MPDPNPAPTSPALAPIRTNLGFVRRFAFRAGLLYLFVYNFDWLTGMLPGFEWLGRAWSSLWLAVVPRAARHVLHISHPVSAANTGSGDTTFAYVQLFCYVTVAVLGGLVWAGFDRLRKRDPLILDLVRTSVRYVLVCSMFTYGWIKVFHQQMPAPGVGRLMEPYGESSPMGLLWAFMGFSAAYSAFAGTAEILGGVLLLWRRTTTLGALVIFGVMSNVALMNFCFDTPVKLYSSHLVLMAAFLAAPDAGRLVRFFLRNEAVPAAELGTWNAWIDALARGWPGRKAAGFSATTTRWLRRALLALKVFIIGWLLYATLQPALEQMTAETLPAEFAGLYKVESFARNGKDAPLLMTDPMLWRQVGVDSYGPISILTVRLMNETTQRFNLKSDAAKHQWTLTPRGVADAKPAVFAYKWEAPDRLLLEGPFQGEAISVRLKKGDASQYLLINRGFHWISEAPFNR